MPLFSDGCYVPAAGNGELAAKRMHVFGQTIEVIGIKSVPEGIDHSVAYGLHILFPHTPGGTRWRADANA